MTGLDTKYRVIRRDPSEFVGRGSGIDAFEKDADFPCPVLQVGTQQFDHQRIVNWDFDQVDPLVARAQPEFSVATSADIAYPLGDGAWSDQIAFAAIFEQIDRYRVPRASLAAGDGQDASAVKANSE